MTEYYIQLNIGCTMQLPKLEAKKKTKTKKTSINSNLKENE